MFIVVVPPLHAMLPSVLLKSSAGGCVTTRDDVELQPKLFVTVNDFVPADAENVPVPVKAEPPVADTRRLVVPPLQATLLPLMATVGVGLTTTGIVFELSVPQAFVPDPIT
jgi:hypothetical protein